MFEDYLKTVLPCFDWIQDDKLDKQLHSIIGYDAAVSLLTNIRDVVFPVVLVEDLPSGNFSFEDGFLNNRVVSLWVMEKAKASDDKEQKEVLRRCFSRGKEIITHIVNDGYDNDNFASCFDRSQTPYFPRGPIAQHCWGYEFMLTFRTDIDMTV